MLLLSPKFQHKPRNLIWGTDRMSSNFTVVYDACVLYPAPFPPTAR